MPRRPTPKALLVRLGVAATTALGICPMGGPRCDVLPGIGIAAVLALAASAGCGGKTPEVDTAELITPKPPAESPKPATPPAEPAKDAPQG